MDSDLEAVVDDLAAEGHAGAIGLEVLPQEEVSVERVPPPKRPS